MADTIICALISAGVTLIISVGTWLLSAKKENNQTREALKADLIDLKDDVTGINATIQNQIAIIDLKIETLSDRVEKHNNVIERVYKLEQQVEDLAKTS